MTGRNIKSDGISANKRRYIRQHTTVYISKRTRYLCSAKRVCRRSNSGRQRRYTACVHESFPLFANTSSPVTAENRSDGDMVRRQRHPPPIRQLEASRAVQHLRGRGRRVAERLAGGHVWIYSLAPTRIFGFFFLSVSR